MQHSAHRLGWSLLSDSGCDSALAEAEKVVSGVREHGERQAARAEGSPHTPCSPRPVPSQSKSTWCRAHRSASPPEGTEPADHCRLFEQVGFQTINK